MTENIKPNYYRARVHTDENGECECFDVIEALGFGFNLGNVQKYIWRAGRKHASLVEDLKKARTYLDREITHLEGNTESHSCESCERLESELEDMELQSRDAMSHANAALDGVKRELQAAIDRAEKAEQEATHNAAAAIAEHRAFEKQKAERELLAEALSVLLTKLFQEFFK